VLHNKSPKPTSWTIRRCPEILREEGGLGERERGRKMVRQKVRCIERSKERGRRGNRRGMKGGS